MDVEKLVGEVARAIAEAEAKAPEYLVGRVPYETTARSAILATLRGVREADEGMAYRGSAAFFDGPVDEQPSKAAAFAYTAMIDHLIKTVEG